MVLSENKDDIVQIIGFYVGQKLFGTDLLSVREIIRSPEIEPSKDGQEIISGIIRLRGEVIPVVDLNARLGEGAKADDGDKTWILIAQTGNQALGFVANSVTRIYKIDPESILPAPELILAGLTNPYIRGVCESELGMLVVLDFGRLLSKEEIQKLEKMDLS